MRPTWSIASVNLPRDAMAFMQARPASSSVPAGRVRDVEALSVAVGTLLILFVLALVASLLPGAI